MVTKAIGIKSAEIVKDDSGNPGSYCLRIVTESGGEILLNLTVQEVRRLTNVLATADTPPFPRAFKGNTPSVDATGISLNGGCHLGKLSLPSHRS